MGRKSTKSLTARTVGRLNGRADMTALSGLVPNELFSVGSAWAVHFHILAVILLWVEVPVLGRTLVVWIWLPLAMWVDASWVFVIFVLGRIVEVLPEVTDSAVDRIVVGVEVQIAIGVTFVVSLDSLLALALVVGRVTLAPRIVVAVTFDETVIWVALFIFTTARVFCWRVVATIALAAGLVGPETGIASLVVVGSAVGT